MTTQDKIDQAVKEKQKRYDKTSASILVSWAINNAVNTLSEEDKKGDMFPLTNTTRAKIKERYPFFIELWQEWMLENGPIEDGDTRLGEKFQEEYQQRSEVEKINEELLATDEIDVDEIPF